MLVSIRLLGEQPAHGIIKVLKNVNFNLGGDFFVFTKLLLLHCQAHFTLQLNENTLACYCISQLTNVRQGRVCLSPYTIKKKNLTYHLTTMLYS